MYDLHNKVGLGEEGRQSASASLVLLLINCVTPTTPPAPQATPPAPQATPTATPSAIQSAIPAISDLLQ